ncbi:MAG: polymerase PolC-type [Pseudomonadota bacterium]
MNWISRFFAADSSQQSRWIVLDVETTGMDTGSDSLLSIGAVALVDGRIKPADSLELLVRPKIISKRDNILIHGIGEAAQASAQEPREACIAFLDFIGQAPLLAFHAAFDRAFLARAVKTYLNQPFSNPWLDVAHLAAAVHPKIKAKSLDEWLAFAGITAQSRHTAAGDAFTTALLLQQLVRASGQSEFEALEKLAQQARWLR